MKNNISLRKFLISTIIIVLFILTCAFVSPLKTITVSVLYDGESFYEANTEIPFFMSLKLFFRYGNSFEKMCENEFKGNSRELLGSINSEICHTLTTKLEILTISPKDACVRYEGNGVFSYEQEKAGQKVDIDKTLDRLTENNFSPCSAVIEELFPSMSLSDLKKATVNISDFSTDYHSSSFERKKNIELAAKKLDGICVNPNEIFSFNETVGKRTAENGFTSAKVIENGVYVDGIGGGVCQVSGTLLNAWLLAGLEVEYSRSHSLPSSYIQPGRDATVSEYIDLKLKNSSEFPVYIDSYYDGKKIGFRLYGIDDGYDVKIETKLIKEIPCDDYEIIYGEQNMNIPPKNGKIYGTKLLFMKNGKVCKEKYFRTSYYIPIKGKIIKERTQTGLPND